MTPRRMRGEGGVTQRADGRWQGSIETTPGPDGRRRRRTIYGHTQREVVRKLAEARRDAEQGVTTTNAGTVGQWLDTWVRDVAPKRVKPKTLASYVSVLERHVKPAIGRHRLTKLTPQHVRQMGADITLAVSGATALKAHAVLSRALTDARREGLVPRNVAELVDRPRMAASTRRALTIPEAVAVIRTAETGPMPARWALALLVGMRQGECLGLRWEHVDLDHGTITVAWQLQRLAYVHGCDPPCGYKVAGSCPERDVNLPEGFEAIHVDGGLWLTRPKSRRGWRTFPIPEPLHRALTALPGRTGLVFTRQDGRPIDPRDDSAAWHALLERAGVEPLPLHTARHTTATLLTMAGVDEQTIMSIMGHAAAVTSRGYVSQAPELQAAGLARIAGMITP